MLSITIKKILVLIALSVTTIVITQILSVGKATAGLCTCAACQRISGSCGATTNTVVEDCVWPAGAASQSICEAGGCTTGSRTVYGCSWTY